MEPMFDQFDQFYYWFIVFGNYPISLESNVRPILKMRLVIILLHLINLTLGMISIVLLMYIPMKFISDDSKEVNEYNKDSGPILQTIVIIRIVVYKIHFFQSQKLEKLPDLFQSIQNSKNGNMIFDKAVIQDLHAKENLVSKTVFFIVTGIIVSFLLAYLYHRWGSENGQIQSLLFVLFVDIAKISELIMVHQFALLNYILHNRFALVNYKLMQIAAEIDNIIESTTMEESTYQAVTYPGWKNSTVELRTEVNQSICCPNIISTIHSLGQTYTQLCNVIDIVCNTFKPQLFISIINIFTYLVIFGYATIAYNTSLFTFTGLLNDANLRVIRNFAFSLFLMMEICLSAEISTREASRCSTLASRIDSTLLHSSIRQEACCLVKRLMYRRPIYDIYGIFNINTTLFVSVIVGMITCIMLLVQLD